MFTKAIARQGLCRPKVTGLNRHIRSLSLHEHVCQSLLAQKGIPVPRGELVRTATDASDAAKRMGGTAMLKAQILAGGRGKGIFDSGLEGGVRAVQSPSEAHEIASQMLGHRLSTKQTTKLGLQVEKIYVTEKVDFEHEFYLSLTVDQTKYRPAFIASRSGGMDIETAAKKNPNSVVRVPFSYRDGITRTEAAAVGKILGFSTDNEIERLRRFLSSLYDLFKTKDATLLEINPLVTTKSGDLICLDSKFTFDDSARSRQATLFALEDRASKDPKEAFAESQGFSYLALDGVVGIMANGAGLAMATMDAIGYYGGTCANFLDAGGKATKETMVNALRIVLGDDGVKALFINIYGGIILGDMVAEVLIGAVKELGPLRIPIVVRLEGTNSEQGRQMLADCGLGIHSIRDFSEAVQKAVDLSKE